MKLKLISFLIFVSSLNSFSQTGQNGISKTFTKIISGTNTYKGATYKYNAKIKFLAMNMGLGDAVVKVGIMSFTIEDLSYNGTEYGYNKDGFPINNAAKQFRVSGDLGLNRSSTGSTFDWYNFTIPMCQEGALDIYYFKEEEAKNIIESNFKYWNSKKSRMDELVLQISSLEIIPEGLSVLDTYINKIDEKKINTSLIQKLTNKIHRHYKLTILEINENIAIYEKLIKIDDSRDYKRNIKDLQTTLENIKKNKSEHEKEKGQHAKKMKSIDRKAERESKQMMQKMRLEQSAYRRSISKYKASGFNEIQATSLVNLEKSYAKMDAAAKQIGNILGNAIGNYFEKKEAKRSTREDARRLFINNFHMFSKELEAKNDEEIKKIKELYFPEEYNPTTIKDQKQRILAFIKMFGNISFPNETNRGSLDDLCIIKQEIEDAYFEEDKLHITFSHKILNSQFDKGSYWDEKFRIKKYKAFFVGHYDYEANKQRIKVSVEYPDKRYPSSGKSNPIPIKSFASNNKGYQNFYYKKKAFCNLKLPKEIHVFNEKLAKTILDSIEQQSLIKKEFNNLVNDKEDGPWKLYHDNSKDVYAIGNYKNGQRTGNWKFYYKSGKLESDVYFVNDKLKGRVKEYYENGNLKSEYTHVRYPKDEDKISPFEGRFKSYKENGELALSIFYKDGLLECIYSEKKEITLKHHNNNQPFTVIVDKPFKKGKLDGILRIYKEDNIPIQESNYKKGIKEGLFKSYHSTGELSQISFYKNGNLNGISKNFDQSGKIRMIRQYNNGKRTGTWKEISSKGNLYYTRKYTLESNVNKEIYTSYYSNGIIKEKIEYIVFQKNNKISYYYFNRLESNNADGSKRDKGSILDGTGTVINYDENGKKTGKLRYKKGIKI